MTGGSERKGAGINTTQAGSLPMSSPEASNTIREFGPKSHMSRVSQGKFQSGWAQKRIPLGLFLF
jgi:hypothetical protein